MDSIGFIGLGHMGHPMAVNLIKAGYTVTVFDKQPAALESMLAEGATVAPSIAELAASSDILITMLQTGDQIKSVCLGDEGLFAHAKPNSLYLDCSTVDVDVCREMHQQAENNDLAMLDAPVSGGVLGAEAGSLTFMVGGEQAVFDRANSLLKVMGKNIIHAGKGGNGQAAKICNNMMLGISMIAVSEGFGLGEKLGLDAKTLFDISSTASAQCWAMTSYCPAPDVLPNVPSSNGYKAGFTGHMMLKDMLLSQNAAGHADAATPLGKAATKLYEEYVECGGGELDFSGIYSMLHDD